MSMGAPRRDPSESVLVVDRLATDRRRIGGWLSESGLAVDLSTKIDAPQSLSRYGVAMLDVDLLATDWLSELSRLKRELPETEIILTTGPRESSVEAAVQAMKLGAYDYLVKPLDSNRIPVLVRKALERRRLSEENRALRERLSLKDEYGRVIGKSRSITDVYEVVDQVAGTSATTLLTGESGTGKELVAKAIHKRSPRASRAFVSLNCGALPEGLLESELFGFERGAFTGAVDAKQGKIEMADGGTLFLDEVGEMSTKTQVEFLRVLQEREFRRLGGDRVVRVDVRIIAATNKDLLAEVREGRFRQDLYYRLAVVPIHLPSLRERREDIPLLVDTFLEEFARVNRRPVKRIAARAMELLCRYAWPGNIRELRNFIERLTVVVDAPVIRPEHLPAELLIEESSADRRISIQLGTPLRKVEELVIRRTLEELTDHRQRAAEILGISPRALHYKIARYGLDRKKRPEAGVRTRSRRP
jgi:DNA-binding NtrC family response regulator